MMVSVTSSLVAYPRIISTSFITGTGFMKCMPITLSGLDVAAAIFVIEIEEVFVDRMQPSGALSSICLKIFSLRSTFSVAASTTNSRSLTPVAKSVCIVILANVLSLSSAEILSLATCRSKFLVMVANPRFSASSERSMSLTSYPN